MDSLECLRLIEFRDDLAEKLTPEARPVILRIKSQVWQDKEYRRSFGAVDIYRAVLDDGVSDVAGFREYLAAIER